MNFNLLQKGYMPALLFIITLFTMRTTQAQQVLPLYNDSIPNSRNAADSESSTVNKVNGRISLARVSRPTLTVYQPAPEKANGTAVIICPGGSYVHLAIGHEGYEVAKALVEKGITAFVLKYRLPSDETMINKEIGPLQDAERAIQLVRERAANWHIDPSKVGIMGFSAGGHLASTAGTHYNHVVIDNKAGINLRPDFMILLYPVISFADSIAHHGSRDNLLGMHASDKKIMEYSNEWQVTAQTPPTFLVQAGDDKVVPVQNSLCFYDALLRHGVHAEMHIYPRGGHGFGLHNPTVSNGWIDLLFDWMGTNGWIRK